MEAFSGRKNRIVARGRGSGQSRASGLWPILLVIVLGSVSAWDVRYGAILVGLALVAFVGSIRLFPAVLLAAMFLPFQRLLAINLGSFNLKIAQVIFLVIFAKILCGKLLTRDYRITIGPFSLPIALFAAVNICSVIWSPTPMFSIGLTAWMLFSVFLSHAVMNVVVTWERLEQVVHYMIYGGIVASVLGIYQFIAAYTGLPSFLRDRYNAQDFYIARVQSTALEPLHYAMFLMTVIPLALALYISTQRRFSGKMLQVSLILMILNLVLTVSRGGYLGFIFASVVVWFGLGKHYRDKVRSHRLMMIFASVGAICLVIVLALSLRSIISNTITGGAKARSGSNMQRIMGYISAYDMFRSHPVFGAGIGSFAYYFWDGKVPDGDTQKYVNSVPIEVAAETGLFGLACLTWFGFSIHRMLKTAIRRSQSPVERALAVGMLASMVSLAVQYLTASPFYAEWTWFAVGLSGSLANLIAQRSQNVEELG